MPCQAAWHNITQLSTYQLCVFSRSLAQYDPVVLLRALCLFEKPDTI